MQKIIKKGTKKMVEFRCGLCGCLWEDDGYKVIMDDHLWADEGIKEYYMETSCPTCSNPCHLALNEAF